ncbi:hypothetical protein HGRIS_009990 [Hohenbuehelia grisea]|uniref:Uncharacterized protein n=1 Tax=Hohenbuehelia grisea TaxID=104357 RepID=A0ABR3J3G5_9AGAR
MLVASMPTWTHVDKMFAHGQLYGFVALLALLTPVTASPPLFVDQDSSSLTTTTMTSLAKVPVQLGVMSRCPDAMLCESVFDKVYKEVGDKIDLSAVYIATWDPQEPVYGVKCMHGKAECEGNIQQLCVAKHSPQSNWWNFLQCQNYQGRNTISDLKKAEECAKSANVPWKDKVEACIGMADREGGRVPEGITLLQESVRLSYDLDIEKSCTIIINKKPVCIHDGGWKQCEGGHQVSDFVRQINEEYDRLNRGGISLHIS